MRLLVPIAFLFLSLGCSEYAFLEDGNIDQPYDSQDDGTDGPDATDGTGSTDIDNDDNNNGIPDDEEDPDTTTGGPGGPTGTGQTPPGDPMGDVEGRVCGPDGVTWLAYATVTVDTPVGIFVTTTDAGGYFTLMDLPVGTWDLTIEKGSWSTTWPIGITDGGLYDLALDECVRIIQDDTTIAVVTGEYDHIEDILDSMGVSYDLYDGLGVGGTNLLLDPGLMAQYDIIFFNCGMDFGWVAFEAQVGTNLATYVNNGGSVYASDWSYYLIEAAYPGYIDFYGDDNTAFDAFVGDWGDVSANVVDPGMQAVNGGASATVGFTYNMWAAASSTTDEVLVSASYPLMTGGTTSGPLATRGQFGSGHIVYTAFHNEAQATLDMEALLTEMVHSL